MRVPRAAKGPLRGDAEPIGGSDPVAIDAARARKVATSDLESALLLARACLDLTDEFDYDRARPIAVRVISQIPGERQELLSPACLRGREPRSAVAAFRRAGRHKTWLRRTLEAARAYCLRYSEPGRAASPSLDATWTRREKLRRQMQAKPNPRRHVEPCTPGDNRPQRGWRTQLILPASGCDTNASVRADA